MSLTTLSLTDIAHGGEAFGRHEGKIIFVPYAMPGERVQVEVVEEKARWARARLVMVLEPSPHRVEPPCPYFGPGRCGGCQWQHIDYEQQLAFKQAVVVDQLRRLAGISDPPVLEPIALADERGLQDFGYRNHVQFMVDAGGRLGFVSEGTQIAGLQGRRRVGGGAEVIAVDECLLLHPLLDEVHAALVAGVLDQEQDADADALDPNGAAPAGPRVEIRRIGLRAGVNTGQRLLLFETAGDRPPGFLVEDLPLRCVVRRSDGSAEALVGDPWIEEEVAGRTFRVSAHAFFQVNTVGAEALVALAGEMLQPAGHETLLDGYCGVGLFGLSLARQVGQVIGIEESEAACDDFAWNARDLDNVALFEGPVAQVLASMGVAQHIDLAIIDPPRSGAGPQVVDQLRRLAARRLLYVSCDPATLARDARLLIDAGYRLQQVQPVDLFPQTYHVESLALFTL